MARHLTVTSSILLLLSINHYSAQCSEPEIKKVKAPTVPEQEFINNPTYFLGKNPITTRMIGGGGNPPIQNGDQKQFGLRRTSGDKSGYELYVKQGGSDGILSWWLETKKTIDIPIPVASNPIFVSTAELQGCTIFVRYNLDDTLQVYHHYNTDRCRSGHFLNETGYYVRNDATGDFECYDDALAYGEYYPWDGDFLCPIPSRGFFYGVTPFIYRNEQYREWRFVFMGYCYDLATDRTPVNLQSNFGNQRPIQRRGCIYRTRTA